MNPCRQDGYHSRFWPLLNGAPEEGVVSLTPPLGRGIRNDREEALLDVIGAFDLLIWQGLSPEGAVRRLGLGRTRDELVWELDRETERRLTSATAPAG